MTIAEAFAPLQDPRQARKVEHYLMDILMLTLCDLISGAQSYTEIVETICEKQADYLLPVKRNQPSLHQAIVGCFDKAEAKEWRSIKHTYERTLDADHGRVETRQCWAFPLPKAMSELAAQWKNLKTIAMIEATREINGESSTERRYFITSLAADASMILPSARAQWSIENGLHWRFDVQMREDESRIRGDGAENVAVLRRIAFNQFRREDSTKRSLRTKQIRASMNDDYLKQVLFQQ